jgi:4-hydroxy-4-methyl-2-oxoglutarate aldolase
MLDNPPLLTIHRGFHRPDKALIEAFRGAQTSHLADAMGGRGGLDYRVKPLDPANASFVGPALTHSPARLISWRCSVRCRKQSRAM